jgi:hypothetical protein
VRPLSFSRASGVFADRISRKVDRSAFVGHTLKLLSAPSFSSSLTVSRLIFDAWADELEVAKSRSAQMKI